MVPAYLGGALGAILFGAALRLVLLAEAGFQPRSGLLCRVGHLLLHSPEPTGRLPSSPRRDCVGQSAKRRRPRLSRAARLGAGQRARWAQAAWGALSGSGVGSGT